MMCQYWYRSAYSKSKETQISCYSIMSFQTLINWIEILTENLVHRVPTTPLDMVIDYFYNDYEDAEPPRVTSLKNTIPRYEFLDFGDQTYFLADSRGFESILIYIAKQFLSHKHEVIRDQRLKLNKVSSCGATGLES